MSQSAAGSPPDASPPPSTTARPAARPELVELTDAHVDAMAEFYRAVWDAGATPERVRAARAREAADNFVRPGVVPPAYGFLLERKLLGYLGTLPVKFWNGTEEHDGDWLKGFMVLPEHRNGPIGYAVLKRTLDATPLAGALAVASAPIRLFEAVGFRKLGCLSNHVLLLRPGTVLQRLDIAAVAGRRLPAWMAQLAVSAQRLGLMRVAGGGLWLGLQAWRVPARLRARRLRTMVGGNHVSDAELNALWHRVRSEITSATVRDAAYLRWRYLRQPETYELIAVRDGETLAGLVVLRRARNERTDARLRGVRVATVSDLVLPPGRPDVMQAALSAAAAHARRGGADALLCSVTHASLVHALRHAGFTSLPGNVSFLIRDAGESTGLSDRLDEWWLTRGDGNSDAVF